MGFPTIDRAFHFLVLLLVGAAGLICTGGCSVGSALGQPAFVEFKDFTLGTPRMRVDELVGAPKSTELHPADSRATLVDYHEFRSGTPGATRLRAVGYLAGDIVTLGLAEVIFWPIELTIAKPHDFQGHWSYDQQQRVNGYRIIDLNNDKKVAKEEGILAENGPPKT